MTERKPYPVEGAPGFSYIAWHGGGAVTLRVGKRHVAKVAAFEGTGPRQTLCGRAWRWSRAVTPNEYWTTGDCRRCFDLVEKVGK